MNDLAAFLGAYPPFSSLSQEHLHRVAGAAETTDHPAGQEILDAFAEAGDDLFVVRSGEVELWSSDRVDAGPPDEVLRRGGVFGQASALSGATVGPRAAALGPVRLVRIPGDAVASAFSSPAGVRLLAHDLFTAHHRTFSRAGGIGSDRRGARRSASGPSTSWSSPPPCWASRARPSPRRRGG